MMVEQNGIYKTSDFQEAIYLRVSGIIFISTEWPTPQQAFFVFKKPPDTVLSAWATGADKGVRVVLDAADFFRDELRRRNK
jgi:hypothetical protein